MSTRYALQVLALASAPLPGAEAGLFVQDADVDAHDGMGQATLTPDRHLAKTWASKVEAFQFWLARSTVRPTRDDGKPNRPLTAYTVEVVPVP